MRILITGHRGYIGSVLTAVLRHARFDVVGVDCDLYGDCGFGRVRETVPAYDLDVRELEYTDLLSFDAVVHLAGLDDGASAAGLPGELAARINEEAAVRVAACCKRAGVIRFVFASTSGVYGPGGAKPLGEETAARPINAFAASKLRCEEALSAMAGPFFSPVTVRLGEVFGMSPRLRLDLAVNDMVASAVVNERIPLAGDGGGWRAMVHVEDVARAVKVLLLSPDRTARSRTFNLVAPDGNRRLVDLADMVAELIPHCVRKPSNGADHSPGCRLDGDRFARAFPEFSFRWSLSYGIQQLRCAMAGAGLTPGDWRSDRYRRGPRLESSLRSGAIDISGRRQRTSVA